jgi:hypothetical protein
VREYQLQLNGIESDTQLNAARWELFTCPEVHDLRRTGLDGHVAIIYDGDEPAADRWAAILKKAGYQPALAA